MKIRERGLTSQAQQMQTLRPINTNTMGSDHTYAVYDRIPYSEVGQTMARKEFEQRQAPLIPGFDVHEKPFV